MGQRLESFDYVFTKVNDWDTQRRLGETHHKITLPLRAWWVPNYQKMTVLNFLNYAITHNPWNSPGRMRVVLFSRKGL